MVVLQGSERLLQRGRGKVRIYVRKGKGEVSAARHTVFKNWLLVSGRSSRVTRSRCYYQRF